MNKEQLNALEEFAKFMDNERNSITSEMWQEKVIWERPDAFQEYLKWFLYKKSPNQ